MADQARELLDSLLREKAADIQKAVEAALKAVFLYANNGAVVRQNAAKAIEHRINAVEVHLKPEMKPEWLIAMKETAAAFREDHVREFAMDMLRLQGDMEHQGWVHESLEAYDFDALVWRIRQEEGVDALVDKIVRILQELVSCELVEPGPLMERLRRLLGTVKKSGQGTWQAVHGACTFLQEFLKTYFLKQLEAIPGIGPLLSSLIETVAHLSDTVDKVEARVADEVKHEIDKQLAPLGVLTYDGTARAIGEHCQSFAEKA